eukprot:6469178-Amphidinium_carterae.1
MDCELSMRTNFERAEGMHNAYGQKLANDHSSTELQSVAVPSVILVLQIQVLLLQVSWSRSAALHSEVPAVVVWEWLCPLAPQ